MKTIQSVTIWANGSTKQATILNAYAVNVALNQSATFYYSIHEQNEDGAVGAQLGQGNLSMTAEEYNQWQQDEFAWEWIASQLNLTITGDYIQPQINNEQ